MMARGTPVPESPPTSDASTRSANNGSIYGVGFSWWKRRHVRTFLQPRSVVFIRSANRIRDTAAIAATWGLRIPGEAFPAGCRVLRLEDGFLRSVGLGAALTPPVSWVIDSRGIYYDANRPSDLEHTLQHHDFSAAERHRAAQLREHIVRAGVTKYNVGTSDWRRPANARKVVLVPGQVETDASIRHGATAVRTNLALLQAVRQRCPDACIIYKPHPDVVEKLRKQGREEECAKNWCDAIVTDTSIEALLRDVDEVHTMTSLAGFEALLRHIKVTTYGRPFYAGWGLTSDEGMTPGTASRRGRQLSLDELVFGALVQYPLYASRVTGQLIDPEQAVEEIQEWQKQGPCRKSLLLPVLRLLRS